MPPPGGQVARTTIFALPGTERPELSRSRRNVHEELYLSKQALPSLTGGSAPATAAIASTGSESVAVNRLQSAAGRPVRRSHVEGGAF